MCATLADQPAEWSALPQKAWQTLPETAEMHGVVALLHERWTNIGWPDAMPTETQSAFNLRHYTQSARSFLLYEQLLIILQALGPEHPIILLKGAALGTTLYRRPELRPLRDIDLLVMAEHRNAARQALESIGYASPPRAVAGLAETHSQIQLHGGPGGGTSVELHWRLAGSTTEWLAPSSDWFWQQSELWRPRICWRAPGSRTLASSFRPPICCTWPLCYPYRWLSAVGRVLRASLALASQHIARRTHQ